MGKEFINDLYYGRIAPWERRYVRMSCAGELDNEIVHMRKSFTEGLSEEKLKSFENLENLYFDRQETDRIESFRQGLQIGALFMKEIDEE